MTTWFIFACYFVREWFSSWFQCFVHLFILGTVSVLFFFTIGTLIFSFCMDSVRLDSVFELVFRCRRVCVNCFFCMDCFIVIYLTIVFCVWLLGTCTCKIFPDERFCLLLMCIILYPVLCDCRPGIVVVLSQSRTTASWRGRCRVVNDHAMWDDWYVVQPDVLHDCAGLAGYISVERWTDRGCSLAVRGCLTVIVLECSISNTSLI